MKRLSKIFLVAGLILFGLSGFTGCAGEVSGSSDTPSEQGGGAGTGDEIAVDFSQSTIPASTYTYPEKIVNPSFVDSSKTVPAVEVQEQTLYSNNQLLSVTPTSSGLLVKVDYNATEASKLWMHVYLKVENVTDKTGAIEVSELEISDGRHSEFLYKFTESGKKYKVWLTHLGSSNGEWADWGTTENVDYVQVTSIGGYGELNSTASDMKIELDADGNRVVNLDKMVITGPASVLTDPSSIPQSVKVRAQKGARWGDDPIAYDCNVYFPLTNNKFTLAYDGNSTDDAAAVSNLNDFINDYEQLFIVLTYRFDFDGKEYKHDCYANYDKWISDYKAPDVPVHQFPLIKIKSTENGGTNYFVTEPIAHHVKDTAQAWEDPAYLNAIPDPWYEKCTIGVNDAEPVEGQVKVRGNWTTSYDKKSLRIKFDKKQNLCGLHADAKFKNWVLLAVWKDASFLRDAAGLYLYKTLFPDYYASDSKLVEVEVNGEYMGVYLLAEQQEVKSGRVDITETDKAEGTDIGYFIEYDSYYTSEVENERFEINYGGDIKDYNGKVLKELQKGYTIKSDINNKAQKEFIMKYMNRLWRICYEAVYNKKYYKFTDNLTLAAYTPEGDTDDKKCENCISAVIDVKSLADMYIFNELVCDPDIYLTSFLMDIDFGEGADRKLRFEAPWDFDSTMGNKRHCADAQGMYAGKVQKDVNFEDGSEHCGNPWMVIFIKQGWFQKLVKAEWAACNPETVCAGLTSYIGAMSDTEYEEVFNYTRNKWGTAVDNDELCDASREATATSQKASADYLKTWITDRFTAVDSVISSLSTN